MEYLDLYDINRQPLGEKIARGSKVIGSKYRMVVHICIFNSDGKMLIQQRSPNKKGFANLWDLSVGGCSQCGETSQQAVHREVLEELGLDIDFSHIRTKLTVNFEHGFDDYYIITRDVELSELTLQEEEVVDAKWADLNEIFSMIDDGTFAPYFKSFIALLFDMRDKPDNFNI